MHRLSLTSLLLLVSLALALPSAAQTATPDLTNTYCAGTIAFNYPAAWSVKTISAQSTDGAAVYASNSAAELESDLNDPTPAHGDVILLVVPMTADMLRAFYHTIAGAPEQVLRAFLSTPSDSIDSPITTLRVGGHPAARVTARYHKTEGSIYIVQYSSGFYGLLAFIAPLGEAARWETTALAVFETVGISKKAACAPSSRRVDDRLTHKEAGDSA